MKFKYLVLFLSAFLFISCGGKTVEEIVETHPDGSPKLVKVYHENGNVRDLTKETQYYPNHKKFYEGEFKDNKKDGDWTVWYDNGNVWSEGHYEKGLDEGKRQGYYETGVVHFSGQYKKGKMVGTWKFFDEQGKLVNTMDYDKKK